MTKQAVIAIIVGVVIILGAGGAFLYSQSKPKNETNTTVSQPAPTTDTDNGDLKSSITDIFSSGKNTKCTFASGDEKGQTNGTVYVSGDNARGDFDVTVNGKTSSTHLIRNADTFYMWGDDLKTGIKMTMNINEMAQKMKSGSQTESLDPDKQIDFKCSSWAVDNSVFIAPTTVKFTSFEGMIPGSAKVTASPNVTGSNTSPAATNQCNICNALSGDAKNACLAQFSCN